LPVRRRADGYRDHDEDHMRVVADSGLRAGHPTGASCPASLAGSPAQARRGRRLDRAATHRPRGDRRPDARRRPPPRVHGGNLTIVTVTDATFDELVVAAEQPVLVDFTADWCPPSSVTSPAGTTTRRGAGDADAHPVRRGPPGHAGGGEAQGRVAVDARGPSACRCVTQIILRRSGRIVRQRWPDPAKPTQGAPLFDLVSRTAQPPRPGHVLHGEGSHG